MSKQTSVVEFDISAARPVTTRTAAGTSEGAAPAGVPAQACAPAQAGPAASDAQLVPASTKEPIVAEGLARILTDASSQPWLLYAVYGFLPWPQRLGGLVSISRDVRDFLQPEDPRSQFWRWLCECICAEALLHFPTGTREGELLASGQGGWRAIFGELWPLRRRFAAAGAVRTAGGRGAAEAPGGFKIAAHCRMRPSAPGRVAAAAAKPAAPPSGEEVALPLHQRLALLRQRRPELSREEAMRMLLKRPEASDAPAAAGAAASSGGAEAGKGALVEAGFVASVLSLTPGNDGSVLTVSPGIGMRTWHFDNVFGQATPQQDVYRSCGLRLAVDLLNGMNGALIVYGQTGSGKTHTLFGPHRKQPTADLDSQEGLVPRVGAEVLKGVEARRAAGFEVSLGASYVEVFGNDVSNLLGGAIGANRAANQRMGHRYILEGQCEEPVLSQEAFAAMLARGEENKRQASTAMNERSSRAHVMVILRLRQRAPGGSAKVESTLFLVDLGGSERVSKSRANEGIKAPGALKAGDQETARVSWQEYYSCRERITETNNINKGLLTLKRCIGSLIERQRCLKEGRQPPRAPFYDSKLTMLLQPAFDGESRTSVVVCCSPDDEHAEETVQTLRFGEMCSSVEHEHKDGSAGTSEAVKQALGQIDEELKALEKTILQKERWEWRKTTRKDVIDEKDTGATALNKGEVMELGGMGAVEIAKDDGLSKKREVDHEVWGQVLVGAERENERREELLRQRRRLLGQE